MLLRIAAVVFLVLHGLVHLWYVVLSRGWVEVEAAMGWNGTSWLLSPVLPAQTILSIASVLYVVVTLGFIAAGIGVAFERTWMGPVLIATAALSTIVLIAMWDGQLEQLVEKGFLGVVINIGIVASLVVLR